MSIYEFDEEREMRLIREDERELGREEGIEIGKVSGREEGRKEGKQRVLMLSKLLLNANRIDDLKRAADDEVYLEELCREYNIS